MNTMLPRAQTWSSFFSFFLPFFQSMKQICALDIASCYFQSTIMTVVHGFPIAVRNQIVLVSRGLQQFDIVPAGEHGQIVIFLVRIKQGYVCAAHSAWLSVWLSYSTIFFSTCVFAHSSSHWHCCS